MTIVQEGRRSRDGVGGLNMNGLQAKGYAHDPQAVKCDRRRSLRPVFRNRGLRPNDDTCDDRNASSRHDPFHIGAIVDHAVEG